MPEGAGRNGGKEGGGGERRRLPPPLAALNLLASPVTALKGVGPALAGRIAPLGIKTVGDLLYHFPRRYLDRSNVTPIRDVGTGKEITVAGRINSVESRVTRKGKRMLTVTVSDGTGYLDGVWFNQDYHRERLKEGVLVAFSGKARVQYGSLQMVNPSYDILGEDEGSGVEASHTGRIVPLYPCTAGVTSATLRRLVSRALRAISGIADPVPARVRERFELPGLEDSLIEVHFPTGERELRSALYRAVFDEIFTMQIGLALKKKRRETIGEGIAHGPPGELTGKFIASLPFELTAAQRRAWDEIARDMSRKVQMNRLLQGEVGSGKTVVALLALLHAVECGHQGALMAPTEVLANQHSVKARDMLAGLPVRVELITSAAGRESLKAVQSGDVDIVIGTHALIQEGIRFADLSVVVVDEQQRFGLEQRLALTAKGRQPDILHMSATPIPRTLALTLYGDLDVSVIDEMPSGRKGVITVVADSRERRGAFALVEKEVRKGRQVFVVCPLVEESEKLEARAAEREAERLTAEFPDHTIGLLHGQMRSGDKRSVMERFARGEIDILISTVVVEVGVDVPNATVMIIENADRFGLAQLHQLRGRVGRGSERGVCLLFADPQTDEAKARMEAIRKYDDGFELAEADLKIRGEGSIFGTRQSGMPDLKMARLTRNFELIRRARKEAFEIVDGDPTLSDPQHRLLRWETNRRFGGALDWLFRA